MPRSTPSRLRERLLLLLVGAALPAIAAVAYSTWVERQDEVAHGLSAAQAETELIALDLTARVDNVRAVIEMLVRDPTVKRGDSAGCIALVKQSIEQQPGFRDIGAILPSGRLFCSTIAVPQGADLSQRPWFREAVGSSKLLVRELDAGPVVRAPTVAVLSPYTPAEGGMPGVVFITLKLAHLANLPITADLREGSTVTLIDEKGTVMYRQPDPDQWVGRSAAGQPIATLALDPQPPGNGLARDLDGKTRLFGFARVQRADGSSIAHIIVGMPEERALAEATRHLLHTGGGLALAALIASAVLWMGINRFVLHAVRAVSQASTELAGGKLDARSGAPSGAFELVQLARNFDEMAEKLERSAGETRGIVESLRESQVRLQALARALIDNQEGERHQIARELHDEIGQALTAVSMNVDALRQATPGPDAARRIEETAAIVQHVLEQVRNMSLDLRPSILDDLGLVAALRWYVARQAEKSDLEIDFRARSLEERLPAEVETACFRIAQEALTNIARHARARRVRVELARSNGELELGISDDGAGFDVVRARERARRGESFGLLGMEERAALLGGSLELTSNPGRGTRLEARIPIPPRRMLGRVA